VINSQSIGPSLRLAGIEASIEPFKKALVDAVMLYYGELAVRNYVLSEGGDFGIERKNILMHAASLAVSLMKQRGETITEMIDADSVPPTDMIPASSNENGSANVLRTNVA
jgi:hypothetical protein